MGGPPSILDQAKQAGAQALASQQQMPQQMPQTQQGLPGVIQNLSAANPSVQKNAEQGQVADMAQKVTAQMQQQSQPPGITGLPAGNMQFSEGGIIPYAAGGGVDLSGIQYGAGMAPSAGIEGALAPTPAMAESPEIAAMREKAARIQALNRARPDYYAQNIAALEADKQARAEAAAQQQKRQGFEGLMALLAGGAKSGMACMGEASTQFNKGVVAQQDAARQANLLDAQMRVKLGELEHARQIGDVNSEMGIEKEIAGIKHQRDQVAVQREGHGVQIRGQDTIAGTATADREARAVENAARNKSQERITAMQREATGNKENLALFKAQAKNLDDAFKKAIAKRSFAPVKAKEEYTELVKEWDALAAQYGLDKKTAPPPPFGGDDSAAPAAAPKADATWGTMKVNGK
jgi:hypothetical protein